MSDIAATTATAHGLVLSNEALPMPASAEEIINILKRVLTKPFVQRIELNANDAVIYVTWYKAVTDSLTVGPPQDNPIPALSRVEITELSFTGNASEVLMSLFLYLEARSLYPVSLIVSSLSAFKTILIGIPGYSYFDFAGAPTHFCGIPLVEHPELAEDTLVALVSSIRGATADEATAAIKLVF